MSRQIIKQPNEKYCIFSSIVDNVTYYNMTSEEIIEVWVEESKKEITQKVNEIIEQLNKNEKPYCQFTKTYEEMIDWIKTVHGKKIAENVKTTIEK